MSTIVKNTTTRGTRNSRLKFLDNLTGYQVHHNDVDPRGYTIKLTSGETVGEVEGLLADTTAKLVRYVEVEIDDDVIERHTLGRYDAEDKHALIPVGLIHIDRSEHTVILNGVLFDHVVDYPRFRKDSGYTTRYEIDANDYLSGFHDYGNSYDRDRWSTDSYRSADRLDDEFYSSDFYATKSADRTQ